MPFHKYAISKVQLQHQKLELNGTECSCLCAASADILFDDENVTN
jgi:hypothetical protein